ncbi:hypothetical protein BGAL_0184g00240 [Botrytis galanthina]|uniref:Ecp2 effector protein domain-containing protein n=1 Tax=Botrytis galanthina TaxID=278940 RepID=A0A4S8QZQ7_9HELO|nr:hypothetical protein BGAL_0184g00240 [Botrytis galanthina]
MKLQRMFCSFVLLVGTAATAQSVLFHGTSVVIIPSNQTSAPGNSTLLAANFFCYMGTRGYFSFGWYVPATSGGDTAHCRPDNPLFHWYEHAKLLSCSPASGTCTYLTQNFPIRAPVHAKPLPLPERPVEYNIKPLDIGNREFGQIAVSYIDDSATRLQVYGIGTREVLKGEECRKALWTLKGIMNDWKPDVGFELEDVCDDGGKSEDLREGRVKAQEVLGWL